MNISNTFITSLAKMPGADRNMFLEENKSAIDFTGLSKKLRTMVEVSVEKGELELAEKYLDIKADIALYEALGRMPAAVSNVQIIPITSMKNKVVMEMCSVQ